MFGSVSTFVHEQQVASDTWTIQHNLGTRAPIVDTWIDLDGSVVKVMPESVAFSDVNTCVVYFNSPRTGTAIIV
jgi:hypothetical protein